MAIFKCKMCGGTVEYTHGETTGVCDSCGTRQTLPIRLDDERRANMYDRANHFRRNNEFDKAEGIYEQILGDEPCDAEVYWSLILCKYGIEYVEDPFSHVRIPTVNRTQYTSIYNDENYKLAIKYADTQQRSLYEQEAAAINEIQKGILAISKKEQPFDIFICYKETDSNGKRTPDSVLANDLYYQLDREGYKVFFSRITLEDKLGTAYEPYIFAALNSAKIMIVLGTRPEYFNAVWVKNEWSRYLALVKESKGEKTLIPAYRDMDPYDLPEEFSHLQALDMNRLGFMQDLIHGIRKIISSEKTISGNRENQKSSGNKEGGGFLQRAAIYLEDGLFDMALSYYDKALDQNPTDANAYFGKMMAELHVKKESELSYLDKPLDQNTNYGRVLKYGDDELVLRTRNYNAGIRKKLAEKENSQLFRMAMDKVNKYVPMIDSNTPIDNIRTARGEIENAVRMFESLHGYKNSPEMVEKCNGYIEKSITAEKENVYNQAKRKMRGFSYESLEDAKRLFQKVIDWEDSRSKIEECNRKEKKVDLTVLLGSIVGMVLVTVIFLVSKHKLLVREYAGNKVTGTMFMQEANYTIIFSGIMILCAVAFNVFRKYCRNRGIVIRQSEGAKQFLAVLGVIVGICVVVCILTILPDETITSLLGFSALAGIVVLVVIKKNNENR